MTISAALVIGALVAFAALVYIVRTATSPFVKTIEWMFAYTPGEKSNEVVSGVSAGARMLLWAGVVGIITWWFFKG
jgi:hypothetical protein